jgi:hypothetical protein
MKMSTDGGGIVRMGQKGFPKKPVSPIAPAPIVSVPTSDLVTFKKSEVREVLNELLAVRNKVSDQFDSPFGEARFDRAINLLHRAV